MCEITQSACSTFETKLTAFLSNFSHFLRAVIFARYQMLCERSTYLRHGRNMDYDHEPNSLNVSIWNQLNGHGRIFNDIGCSLM